MIRRFRLGIVAVCVLSAVFLLRYSVDREFINLAPTPGAAQVVPLKAGVAYELQLTARKGPITRLGFFLKPLQENLPTDTVTLVVKRNGVEVARSSVATPFIDAQGFTQWRVDPPLSVTASEKLQVMLVTSAALSEKIGVQLRLTDDTFTATDAVFSLDGVVQPNPIAHQVYFAYRPAFASHVAGLLLLAAGVLLCPVSLKKYAAPVYALALALVAYLPVLRLEVFPLLPIVTVAAAWWGMFRVLKGRGAGIIPAVVGAHAAGLTTFFALHLLAGQSSLAFLGLLPIAFSFKKKPVVYVSALALLLAAIVPELTTSSVPTASLRDVWLDTNQAAQALKIPGTTLPWWHFGSYVGVLNALLGGLGIFARGKKEWRGLALLAVGLLLVQVVGPHFLPNTSFTIPWAYLIIVPTFALAYFIGLGAEALRLYLGASRAATIILVSIGLVGLLDLLYVLTSALESFYL